MKNVTISIVTYKALDRAKACVEAVLKHSGDAKLVLTANGSLEARAYFHSVADAHPNRITVIHHAENIGFGRAHNAAFGIVPTTPFFLCLNDDTVPPEGWLNTLMAPFDKDPKAALSCPSNTCSQLLPTFHGRPGAREYCEGSCLLIRSEVARKHGLFDETLPGLAYGEDSDIFFSGKTLKMVSVLASLAAAKFATVCPEGFADRLPHFDCRVFQLPSRTEAANAFLWRAMDCKKNAISMVAQSLFSAKQLHGKNQVDMHRMVAEAGIVFDSYPAAFRRGAFLRRETISRLLTVEELARIPEKHRPCGPVLRTSVEAIDMPEFHKVTNRVEVIFDGAPPRLHDDD